MSLHQGGHRSLPFLPFSLVRFPAYKVLLSIAEQDLYPRKQSTAQPSLGMQGVFGSGLPKCIFSQQSFLSGTFFLPNQQLFSWEPEPPLVLPVRPPVYKVLLPIAKQDLYPRKNSTAPPSLGMRGLFGSGLPKRIFSSKFYSQAHFSYSAYMEQQSVLLHFTLKNALHSHAPKSKGANNCDLHSLLKQVHT